MIFNKPYIPFYTATERDDLKEISTTVSKSQERKKSIIIKVVMCLNLPFVKFWGMKKSMKRAQH